MPLTQRAELLSAWIDSPREDEGERPALPLPAQLDRHRRRVRLVARSRSAQKLIAADRIAQQRWGIGKKSELVARRALADVEARTK